MENNIGENYIDEDIKIRLTVDKYLSFWRWFVLGILLCLIGAFLYVRYTKPTYQSTTTILVKDEKKGGMLSELSAFTDLGIGGGVNNVDNEIEVLKSRTLVERTVEKLNLTVSLIAEGAVIASNLYDKAPVVVQFYNRTAAFYDEPLSLNFKAVDDQQFELLHESAIDSISFFKSNATRFKYDVAVATAYGDLVVRKKKDFYNWKGDRSLVIVIRPFDDVVESYRNNLQINSLSKTSSVLSLSIVDAVPDKANDFLNTLVRTYNEDAVEDKNSISENTSAFIANRLSIITNELDGVETDVAQFKRTNKLTNVETDAAAFLEGSTEYNKKAVEIEIQSSVVRSMLDYLKKSSASELLPTNLISSENGAAGLVNEYNELILNRNRIAKSAMPNNPTLLALDQQIGSLRASVLASLNRMQSSLAIQKGELSSKEGELNSKIGQFPAQEQKFRVIARQQKVKEELYLYLLQKREETAISLAATEPNARVIDVAKAKKTPVAPKKNIIYLAAILLGLLIPFGIIYIRELLDNKITSRLDLEGKTTIPFVGDVPISDSPNELIQSDSRSSSAEALRIIRTNLEFMLNNKWESTAKTIFLTSTFPAEGKTFVSVNLASTFALSGKRVLLMGMDVRNPRLDDYLTLPERGLTNYLSSKDLVLDDLIVKYNDFNNLYVLPAGVIPPNPAELLMSKKIDEVFEKLKKEFDYIIVDTAPVSLVTDTLLIAKHADCFVYVVRANYLEKRMLSIPNTLYREKKLPNMSMLLNATDSSKGYGYGYGYGVTVTKKPWYKRILKD